MPTVFIVTVKVWDDTDIMGVFSTREKAEAYIATLKETDRFNSELTEWAFN